MDFQEKTKSKVRSYWLDGVFIDQGKYWATDMVEIGNDHCEAKPLYLGKESSGMAGK